MSEVQISYRLHLREGCPFCDAALDLVRDKGVEYIASFHERGDEALITEQARWNHTTVPVITKSVCVGDDEEQVFFIGGFTDLERHFEEESDG
jgi:glutaredoxin